MSKKHFTHKSKENPRKAPEKNPVSRRKFLKLAIAGLATITGITASIKSNVQQTTRSPENKDSSETAPNNYIEAIQQACRALYLSQQPISLESAKNLSEMLNSKIAEIINKHEHLEPGKSPQEVAAFLKSKGYFLAISPIPIGGRLFLVNIHFHKIGSPQVHNTQNLGLPGFRGTKIGFPVHPVEEAIIDDVRTFPTFPKQQTQFDGMTISATTGEATVLIFPDRITENAQKNGIKRHEYENGVITNELSQIVFQEHIPQKYFPLPISRIFKGLPEDWTIHHLQEAFSDWATLKSANKEMFIYELQRITTTKNFSYAFSKTLVLTILNQHKIPSNLRSLNSQEFENAKNTIIQNFENALKQILIPLARAIKSINSK